MPASVRAPVAAFTVVPEVTTDGDAEFEAEGDLDASDGIAGRPRERVRLGGWNEGAVVPPPAIGIPARRVVGSDPVVRGGCVTKVPVLARRRVPTPVRYRMVVTCG